MVSIWLPGEEEIDKVSGEVKKDFEVITRNRIVIKNLEKYNELMRLLKDKNTYINVGHINLDNSDGIFPGEGRTLYGYHCAYKSFNDIWDDDYACIEITYENPRAYLTRLLNLDNRSERISYGIDEDYLVPEEGNFNLTNLFGGNVVGLESKIKSLEADRYSNEELIKTLNKKFGDFGLFTTEALDCIDFEKVEEYRKSDLYNRLKFMKKEIDYLEKNNFGNNNEHAWLCKRDYEDYQSALAQYHHAKDNQKVLSLARRIHSRIK